MAFVKICWYVTLIVGFGYGALKFTQLNEENVKKQLAASAEPISDAEKKRKLMMEVLKSAAENKDPIIFQQKKTADK